MACPICGKRSVTEWNFSDHRCNPRRLSRIDAADRKSSVEDDDIQEQCETFSCKLEEGFAATEHTEALQAIRRRYVD